MIKKIDYELFPNKAKKDAKRHRDKVKETIKKNIADIIAEEAIITRKGKKIVKVPIKGLKSYEFIFDRGSKGGAGIGHGKGKPGDSIGKKAGKHPKKSKAVHEPGVDYFETEIDLEELIQMMLEDLGLPKLEQKNSRQLPVFKDWTFDSIEKVGPMVRLDKKRTIRSAILKSKNLVRRLVQASQKSAAECESVLNFTKGDFDKSLEILKSGKLVVSGKKFILIEDKDKKFRTLKEAFNQESNAVVLVMMDTSASMTTMKKYLVRSFFFWFVEFLRKIYNRVEIRFIVHDFKAKLVPEEDFFKKGESGGTFAGSAYELAKKLIDSEYNPKQWNIYAFHFSDGDDEAPQKSIKSAKSLIDSGINMFGYGEIIVDDRSPMDETLMDYFREKFELEDIDTKGKIEIYAGVQNFPFLGVVIKGKKDIWPALQEFLNKNRWRAK